MDRKPAITASTIVMTEPIAASSSLAWDVANRLKRARLTAASVRVGLRADLHVPPKAGDTLTLLRYEALIPQTGR
jgi:hypothetical protein